MNKKTGLKLLLGLILVATILSLVRVGVRKPQEIRRGAFYGSLTASLYPSEKEVAVGEEFNLYLKINPVSENEAFLVNGADLTIGFDENRLEFVDGEIITPYTGQVISLMNPDQLGKLRIIAVTTVSRDEIPQDVFDLVRLRFRAKAEGEVQINQEGDYQLVGSRGQSGDIDRTLELSSFSGTTITISGEIPEGGWPVLKFKIKFGGTDYEVGGKRVIVEVPPQKVKVAVGKDGLYRTYNDITVTCDEDAVCQGEMELVGITPGDNYAVLIKGPVHLAKKFCQDQQREYCWRGDENISLASGDNQFDWTTLPLEPGDVNQDKRVDSLDFSRVKNALGARGDNIPEDVNFNGEVNSQDLVFVLGTLGTKYEDDI